MVSRAAWRAGRNGAAAAVNQRLRAPRNSAIVDVAAGGYMLSPSGKPLLKARRRC